jgi:putative transposase
MDTTISIQDFVNNVKSNGFRAMRETVTDFIRFVMERVLSVEQYEQVGCEPYERSQQRVDYANGAYQRTLSTSYGVISNLRIPRLRRSRFITKLLERYKRRTNELDHALLTWYLQGESCRDVTRSINAWTQDILSAQSVSRLLQNIDQELLSWRQRPLPSDLTAVWLDGFSIKTGVKQKVRSCVILAALGRYPDGKWEILCFRLAETESEYWWAGLLHQMYRRGLRSQLFIHDGAGGIAQALRWIYPFTKTQRCLVHKIRNILDAVSNTKNSQEIKRDFWFIYQADSLPDAQERFRLFCRKWHHLEPKAVLVAKADLSRTLAFFSLPEHLRILCRSTNTLEWVYRELRRRVKVISSFPNPKSCERIVFLTLIYIKQILLNKSGNMTTFFSKFTHK